MPLRTDNNSRSLRRQADKLELKIAGRQRTLRFRFNGIKQTILTRLTSPTALLLAFGTGVVLEQTGHRRRNSLAYLLNAGYAGVRLLASLSSAIWMTNRSQQEGSLDHVQPN